MSLTRPGGWMLTGSWPASLFISCSDLNAWSPCLGHYNSTFICLTIWNPLTHHPYSTMYLNAGSLAFILMHCNTSSIYSENLVANERFRTSITLLESQSREREREQANFQYILCLYSGYVNFLHQNDCSIEIVDFLLELYRVLDFSD